MGASNANAAETLTCFGDSITKGSPYVAYSSGDGRVNDGGYEPVLHDLLLNAGLDFDTLNYGVSGEHTVDGVNRLVDVLNADASKYVLLMEGSNDVYYGLSSATTFANLRTMVDRCKSYGATRIPLLSTLLPREDTPIPSSYNVEIANIAAEKGILLVDQYAAFINDWDVLNHDGVHPNRDGYDRMAETWGNAIIGLEYGYSTPNYFEDFENDLGSEWSTYRSDVTVGRQWRTDYSAYSGTYSWRMDVNTNDNYNLNELVLQVNVSGASYLDLSFSTREYSDEQEALPATFSDHENADGIAVSNDGYNWTRLWQYPENISGWMTYIGLHIGSVIPINGNVYIKFQQYDNYKITSDGILWDDIKLFSDGTVTLQQSSQPPLPATSPSPGSGATNQSINSVVSWSNGGGATSYDVYFGTNSTPDAGESKGNQTSTSYDPGILSYATTYYWRIDAKNTDGTTTGNVWSFTTEAAPSQPPLPATSPSPGSGATNQSINAVVGWSNGGGATSYDVYFGTDSTPDAGESKGNQTSTSYDPGALSYATTYYWRIDAKNTDGTTTGNVWSFTTEAAAAASTYFEDFESPLDGEWSMFNSNTDFGRNERSDYAAYNGTYSWRMDVTSNENYNLNELILRVNVSGASYLDLSFSTIHYSDEQTALPASFIDHTNADGIAVSNDGFNWTALWQYLDANGWATYSGLDIGSVIPINGDVYIKFQQYDNYTITTDGILWDDIGLATDGTITLPQPPLPATAPSPGIGASSQSTNTVVGWSDGGGATSYDVYFGTDSSPDAGESKGNQTSNSYDPGTLSYATTYYWRIDAKNTDGTTTGNVWSFTTEAATSQPPLPATSPSPGSGATNQSINAVVGWSNGGGATSYDVYFGTDSTPDAGESKGNQTSFSYDPGTLDYTTTYYWRIDAKNADGTTTGNVWSFTTESASSTSTYFENFENPLGSEWSMFNSNTGYGRNERSDYAAYNGTYSWRMDVTSSSNYNLNELVLQVSVSGASYLDLGFSTINYSDEQTALPAAFSGHENADGIAVSNDGINWSTLWQYQDTSGWASYSGLDISSLIPINGIVHIKFQQYDNYPISSDGILWDDIELVSDGIISLPQPPSPAIGPSPVSGASSQFTDTVVGWSDGGGAISYNVYFGTNAIPGNGEFMGNQTSTSYDHGQLKYATTYYWRIDAVNGDGTTTGNVWSFTTESAPPGSSYFEDFESPLGSEWSTYHSNAGYGRNERSDYAAHDGTYSWRMDVTSNGNYNLNELVLQVSVSGASYLDLSFFTREYSDEQTALPAAFIDHTNADGIAVSNDNYNWTTLWQYDQVSGWTLYSGLEIGSVIPINGEVYIKFQQYDNYTITSDGILWDDIELVSDGTIAIGGS